MMGNVSRRDVSLQLSLVQSSRPGVPDRFAFRFTHADGDVVVEVDAGETVRKVAELVGAVVVIPSRVVRDPSGWLIAEGDPERLICRSDEDVSVTARRLADDAAALAWKVRNGDLGV